MYNISETTLNMFMSSAPQRAKITFDGVEEDFIITEADIIVGGLSINRYCVSGERIEIGSAVAAELTLQLNNPNGKYDDVVFEGGELNVQVGVFNGHYVEYIPMGIFTIDEAPRKLAVITLTALDKMVRFDKLVDWDIVLGAPYLNFIAQKVCQVCDVSLGTNILSLPNGSHHVKLKAPAETGDITYRQIISWIAEITGTCAYIDWNGKLKFEWYSDEPVFEITPSERFQSDLEDLPLMITGVMIEQGEVTPVLAGTDDYTLLIQDNMLLEIEPTEDNPDAGREVLEVVADNILNVVGGFEYTPFSATTKPLPHIYPLDAIKFIDKNGITHNSNVTEVTFTMNKNTSLKSKGESATRKGWATANPLTNRERSLIKTLLKDQSNEMNDRIKTVRDFNDLMRNALGLYYTEEELIDGSKQWFMHDNEDITQSKVIFTFLASGFAWTNLGWNDGDPTWQHGITEAGDALFRHLSATGIGVQDAHTPYKVEITPSSFLISYENMVITRIIQDELVIPKGKFVDYMEVGKVQFVPFYEDDEIVGTNIVYID